MADKIAETESECAAASLSRSKLSDLEAKIDHLAADNPYGSD